MGVMDASVTAGETAFAPKELSISRLCFGIAHLLNYKTGSVRHHLTGTEEGAPQLGGGMIPLGWRVAGTIPWTDYVFFFFIYSFNVDFLVHALFWLALETQR